MRKQTQLGNINTAQAAIHGARREGRDREGFDLLVEGGVIMFKTLVMAEIARARPVVDGADDARKGATNTAGSLDILGCGLGLAGDHHQAQAADIDPHGNHIGGQNDIVWALLTLLRWKCFFQPVEDTRNIHRRFARSQFLSTIRFDVAFDQTARVHLAQARAHSVIRDAAHAAQFAHRVEISDQGHPGIGQAAVVFKKFLSCRQISNINADQDGFHTCAGGADAQIQATRGIWPSRATLREEVVAGIQPGWREDLDITQEQVVDLILRAADGGSRGDHLGAHADCHLPRCISGVQIPRAKPVYSGFVEPDERTERTANQMQFVLDDQIWRAQGQAVLGFDSREFDLVAFDSRMAVTVFKFG